MGEDRELNRICGEMARLLIEERKKRNLSMNELASRAGLSQSRISMFEAAPGNPTIKTLLRIARALGISLGELIRRAENAATKDS